MNPAHGRGRFATTHWSLVLAAARDEDRDGCRAMESLCEQCWYPLYVFVRRRGYAPEDAQAAAGFLQWPPHVELLVRDRIVTRIGL